MHAFPAVFPIRIGEQAPKNFGIQIALAVEIGIESAVGEACTCHDLGKRDLLKSIPVE
jgi:hypothetical protein